MNKQKRKLIIEEVKNSLENYKFRLKIHEIAIEILTPFVGKQVTKREGNKILTKLQETYPEATFYFKKESWSKDFEFLMRGGWGAKDQCRESLGIDSLTSEGIYTEYLHTRHLESLEYKKEHLRECQGRLDNINELIDLHEKQEQEIEELQKRQERERKTFVAQTKCVNADISHYIKMADEALQKMEQEEYYRKQREEFDARNNQN